ncbi:hypothetical protein BJ546DRAFT_1068439 [Cryomyces antarcticus]
MAYSSSSPPILDSHVHLWPASASNSSSHSWMTPGHPLAHPHLVPNYLRATTLLSSPPPPPPPPPLLPTAPSSASYTSKPTTPCPRCPPPALPPTSRHGPPSHSPSSDRGR